MIFANTPKLNGTTLITLLTTGIVRVSIQKILTERLVNYTE